MWGRGRGWHIVEWMRRGGDQLDVKGHLGSCFQRAAAANGESHPSTRFGNQRLPPLLNYSRKKTTERRKTNKANITIKVVSHLTYLYWYIYHYIFINISLLYLWIDFCLYFVWSKWFNWSMGGAWWAERRGLGSCFIVSAITELRWLLASASSLRDPHPAPHFNKWIIKLMALSLLVFMGFGNLVIEGSHRSSDYHWIG